MNSARRIRILVIEDDQDLRESLQDVLSDIFDVEAASNGIDGVKAALSSSFDIVVTDVKMPGLDGFQTIDILRSNDALKNLPILVISGHKMAHEVALQSSRLGAVDFLEKPFEVDTLFLRIRAAIASNKDFSATAQAEARTSTPTDLFFDAQEKTLAKGPVQVSLSQTEALVLKKLIANYGNLVLRADLLEAAWNSQDENPKVINAHMVSLKQKIKPLGLQILTVYGKGYRLEGWAQAAA